MHTLKKKKKNHGGKELLCYELGQCVILPKSTGSWVMVEVGDAGPI